MPHIDPRITAGNIITIVAMAIGLALAWGSLTMQGSSAAKSLEDHEARIRALEAQVLSTLTRMDARLSAIEGAVTR